MSGTPMCEREDLTSDCRLPDVRPRARRDRRSARAGGSSAAARSSRTQRRVDVHPDARGRGIGTWLRTWTEDGRGTRAAHASDRRSTTRARTRGELLTTHGYSPRHTSWILAIDRMERARRTRCCPTAITLRAVRPGRTTRRRTRDVRGRVRRMARSASRRRSTTWAAMTIRAGQVRAGTCSLAEDGGRDRRRSRSSIDYRTTIVGRQARGRVATHRHRGHRARAAAGVRSARSFDRGVSRVRPLDGLATPARSALYEQRRHAGHRATYTHLATSTSDDRWRWPRDSNPRESCPPTRFPGASLRPLGQATATSLAGGLVGPAARRRPQMLRSKSDAYSRRPIGRRW